MKNANLFKIQWGIQQNKACSLIPSRSQDMFKIPEKNKKIFVQGILLEVFFSALGILKILGFRVQDQKH